ncbi:hypothetical protein [Streptomyces sp. NPDC058953]
MSGWLGLGSVAADAVWHAGPVFGLSVLTGASAMNEGILDER